MMKNEHKTISKMCYLHRISTEHHNYNVMASTRHSGLKLPLVISLLLVAISRQMGTLGMDDVTASTGHKTSPLTTPKARTSPDVTRYDYVGYVSVPLLFVTGLLGNSLTVVVMAGRGFRSMPVSTFLVALAVSDTWVKLLFPLNKPFVRQLLGSDVRALSHGGCRLFMWAYRYAKTTSSWILCLITLERFVAVRFPMQAKKINTKRNAYIAIATVYCVLAAYIGYWCSWADRVISGACIPNIGSAGQEHMVGVFLVVGLSLYAYIPASLLLILNSLIVYKLCRQQRHIRIHVQPANVQDQAKSTTNAISAMSQRQRTQRRTTYMLMGVSLAFVAMVTPNAVSHIVAFVRKQNVWESTDPGMIFLREVSQVMEQMNSSINFFLYVLGSERFRQRVRLLFRRDPSPVNEETSGMRETTATPAISVTARSVGSTAM